MTHLRERPLAVETREGWPWRLGRDREEVAEVLDGWRDAGCWWEGEEEKVFFRLRTRGGQLLEIYRRVISGDWYLYREYD